MAPPAGPTLTAASLAIVVVESVLYGFFLLLFCPTFSFLARRYKSQRDRASIALVAVSVIIFGLLSSHWALDVARAFFCFLRPTNGDTGTCFEDLADPRYLASTSAYVIICVIGDGFMVYRLYVVWGKGLWIIILPALLDLGLLADGLTLIYHFSRSGGNIFLTGGSLITAAFVIMFLDNLYCTLLIAYKIWRANINLSSAGFTGQGTMKIVHLLIQSAALYSTCLLLSLGLYLVKSNVQFVAVAVCSQVVGINFCTIMSQGRARVTSTSENTNNSLPLRSMAIRITTDTNRHTDVENQLRDSKAIVLGADAEGAEFDPSGSMSK